MALKPLFYALVIPMTEETMNTQSSPPPVMSVTIVNFAQNTMLLNPLLYFTVENSSEYPIDDIC